MKKKTTRIIILILVSLTLLSGCTGSPQQEEQVQTLVIEDLDKSLDQVLTQNYNENYTSSNAVYRVSSENQQSTTDYGIFVGFYWSGDEINRTTNVNLDQELGLGTVSATFTIPAEVMVLKEDGNIMTKEATLKGRAFYEVEKQLEQWVIVGREIEMKTINSKLVIDAPKLFPYPAQSEDAVNIETTITGSDQSILTFVKNSAGEVGSRTRLLLDENGDSVYSNFMTGPMYIKPNLNSGTYPGFILAIAHGSLSGVNTDVQISIKSFNLEVADNN